jgi:phosphoribosylamine-glycine ligase
LAIQAAYAAVQKIHFDGMQYRKDIGQRVYKVFQQPKA